MQTVGGQRLQSAFFQSEPSIPLAEAFAARLLVDLCGALSWSIYSLAFKGLKLALADGDDFHTNGSGDANPFLVRCPGGQTPSLGERKAEAIAE